MERALQLLSRIPIGPLIAVVSIIGLSLMSNTLAAAQRVPDLEGLEVNAAIAKAVDDGYFTRLEWRRLGGIAGTVVGQEPEAKRIENKGSTIVLKVTRGSAQVKVPELKGLPVDEARRRVDRGNLTPGAVVYERSDGEEANRVIRTEPKAGTLVDVGTTVDIIAAD